MSEPRSGARSREVYRALQRQARKEGRGTQELFEFCLLERFLFRLSISEYRDHFVLKGGLLLTAVGARRPTRDVDVLARNIKGDEGSLLSVVREVTAIYVEDGVSFDASSARTTMIREQEVYPGIRIVVPANLGTARLQLRLDINVGDPVHPRQITYPTGLSDEPFTLLGYPVETVVAEKVDTMITRGDANTRERDYADVLMLSRTHALESRALRKVLEETALDGRMIVPALATPMFRPGRSAIEDGPAHLIAQPLVVQHEFSDLAGKLCPLPPALQATGLLLLSFGGRRARP